MIIVVSNRLVHENGSNDSFFGEILNPQGVDKITIAKAFYQENQKSFLKYNHHLPSNYFH